MKVVLGTLKDKGEALATFLEPRVGAKPSLSGDAIEIEDESMREGVKPRQVKTYIKRFLFMNGVRKNYRVFVVGKELTIQEIELGEEEEEEKPKKAAEAPAEEKPEAEEAPAPAEAPAEAPEEPKAKPKKAAAKKPRAKKKAEES
jgi:pyruvate/2-oxoglutarate dehydrogenase complex dihydrolipoamide acyltransferase (E2) component